MRVEHIKRRVSEQMLGIDTIKYSFESLMKIGRENISRQHVETRLDAPTEEWEKFRVNHLTIKANFVSQTQNVKKPRSVCSELHYINKCLEFKAKLIHQRLEIINKGKMCFNCLGHHKVSTCQSTIRCFICGRKHHTLLHEENSTPRYSSNQPSTTKSPKQVYRIHHSSQDTSATIILLATARVKVTNNKRETITARALLDQGSEISLVSQNLIQRLRIQKRPSSVPILGVEAQKYGRTKGIASITIQPHFNSATNLTFDAHILSKLTSLIPSAGIIKPSWPHHKGLALADPDFTEPGHIDLIIGADMYGQLQKVQ